jgi:hypothetical protein
VLVEFDVDLRVSALAPVGQHQQRLVPPAGGGIVLGAGDLVREMVTPFGAAPGDESRVGTSRIWAGEPAGVSIGADLLINAAGCEIKQLSVASPCPHLAQLDCAAEELSVAIVGRAGGPFKHRRFGVGGALACRSRVWEVAGI